MTDSQECAWTPVFQLAILAGLAGTESQSPP